MLQSDNSFNSQRSSSNQNSFTPVKNVSSPIEQASIGRSLVIKGEVSGSESLYIDGRIEGSLNFGDHRVTVGRNGNVDANINAREVVIMGVVKGNIQCGDRVDIRAEGSLTGDIVTQRISVEDGAMLTGSVQVRSVDHKNGKSKDEASLAAEEKPKAMAASAGN
jgi:cytoskeletal protein CcmA (bactofilin family)